VANVLCQRLNVRCIISEVGREFSWRKLRRNLSPAVLGAKAYRRVQPLLFPPDEDAARFLFPDGRPRFEAGDLVVRAPHINAPVVLETLKRNRVDFIAVFGTSLLRHPAFFSLAPARLLNLHGGLSPWYRGADSTFWALYNCQIERVGCTIHLIDRTIDSGRLIAHVCPPVQGGDREQRLFLNAIRTAAPIYAEAIRRIDRGEKLGVEQPPAELAHISLASIWDRGVSAA
jgi:methionyl-tRNA formyltransferase